MNTFLTEFEVARPSEDVKKKVNFNEKELFVRRKRPTTIQKENPLVEMYLDNMEHIEKRLDRKINKILSKSVEGYGSATNRVSREGSRIRDRKMNTS